MEHAAIIDSRTPGDICSILEKTGLRVIKIPCTERVSGPVSGHPDIQLFIHRNTAFVHPHIDLNFLKQLENFCDVKTCTTALWQEYPSDIPYNIACTGSFAIHRLDRTEPSIQNQLKDDGITLLDVKQGYSKCSTLVVDEKSIITPDASIDAAARSAGMDSLLISPGHVDLPGYRYGFIGGAAGRFMNMVLLTGTIDGHPDRDRIHEFIESRGLKVKVLSKQRVLDTGSILVVDK